MEILPVPEDRTGNLRTKKMGRATPAGYPPCILALHTVFLSAAVSSSVRYTFCHTHCANDTIRGMVTIGITTSRKKVLAYTVLGQYKAKYNQKNTRYSNRGF